ncbi:2-oxoglutarate dehydrogenase E1 component [Spirochaetota bacterium]|nr:2-oxoglutarate dehydrogenase E1 component [Spirochaetota bacterium]
MKKLIDYQYLSNSNNAYIEELYEKYLADPASVSEKWRYFFEGFQLREAVANQKDKIIQPSSENLNQPLPSSSQQSEATALDPKEIAVTKLIQAYRARGYTVANLNPFTKPHDTNAMHAQLDLEYFGLKTENLDRVFKAGNELKIGPAPLKQILHCLQSAYTETMGVEFTHCNDANLRVWLYNALEPSFGDPRYTKQDKLNIFESLTRAVIFENFLQKKYIGQKRFGLEGGEALIPALDRLINRGAELGVEEFVFGMAHRGRLNVLVNIMQKSYSQLFTEFEGGTLPEHIKGDGDVKYHLGQSTDIEKNGKSIHLSLAFNPSHLEAVDPIVAGMVRAKCEKYYNEQVGKIVPILIHGDAAVAGQGVVYELANMSQLPGYNNGGTIHVVIDNQVGFTATSRETRSSLFATDIAHVTDSPIFHVNGDDPLKVAYAFELAIALRQKFSIDVWINMICYRRYGHNESDDPNFTNPKIYALIKDHPHVLSLYKDRLLSEGILSEQQAKDTQLLYEKVLNEKLNKAREYKTHIHIDSLKRYWQDIRVATERDMQEVVDTTVSRALLDKIATQLTKLPQDFNVYRKVKRIIDTRKQNYFEKGISDWAFAEALAFGSLLSNRRSVRLAGQDSARGTFSHRHAVLKDMVTEKKYVPLANCVVGRSNFLALNTQLSEYSILGFEYGYSLARPHALVIWEAQFGDFANCAQVVIDQFITSGESKWQRYSGIILLLPHGYEGMGPEHSSARLERFLQMCADNNIFVTNVTTPANFFHLLRRPILSPFRKPTIVMSPKSLIRHSQVISPISDFTDHRFQEVIDDPSVTPAHVTKVLLCSGKIYFELLAERENAGRSDIAIIRLEQLYPLVKHKLLALKKKYAHIKKWTWVQEEPKNMGAWSYLLLQASYLDLTCVSRKLSSSTASGMLEIHKRNQKNVIHTAIYGDDTKTSPQKKAAPIKKTSSHAYKNKKPISEHAASYKASRTTQPKVKITTSK